MTIFKQEDLELRDRVILEKGPFRTTRARIVGKCRGVDVYDVDIGDKILTNVPSKHIRFVERVGNRDQTVSASPTAVGKHLRAIGSFTKPRQTVG